MKKIYLIFLILSFSILPMMNSTEHTIVYSYDADISVNGAILVFDISKEPYHDQYDFLMENLGTYYNHLIVCEEELILPDSAGALFIPSYTESTYTLDEKNMIRNWMQLGDKLLFIGGDSDYGGYYNPTEINDLLQFLVAQIYFDRTSIEDPDSNDGSAYRTAPQNMVIQL